MREGERDRVRELERGRERDKQTERGRQRDREIERQRDNKAVQFVCNCHSTLKR